MQNSTTMETDDNIFSLMLSEDHSADYEKSAFAMGVDIFKTEFGKTQIQNCIDVISTNEVFTVQQRLCLRELVITSLQSSTVLGTRISAQIDRSTKQNANSIKTLDETTCVEAETNYLNYCRGRRVITVHVKKENCRKFTECLNNVLDPNQDGLFQYIKIVAKLSVKVEESETSKMRYYKLTFNHFNDAVRFIRHWTFKRTTDFQHAAWAAFDKSRNERLCLSQWTKILMQNGFDKKQIKERISIHSGRASLHTSKDNKDITYFVSNPLRQLKIRNFASLSLVATELAMPHNYVDMDGEAVKRTKFIPIIETVADAQNGLLQNA